MPLKVSFGSYACQHFRCTLTTTIVGLDADYPAKVALKGLSPASFELVRSAVVFTCDGCETNAAAALALHQIAYQQLPELHPDKAMTLAVIADTKMFCGDAVGALLDAAANFTTGSVADKLNSLSAMKTLVGDNSFTSDLMQAIELRQLDCGDATLLAEHGPLPVHIMGQQQTLADLLITPADELQRFYLSAILAKLVPKAPAQADKPVDLSTFRIDSSYIKYADLRPADMMQQRGACQLYLCKPAEAVAELTAALQQGDPSWLTYHYRAAAHEALGNDKAAAEDKAEESRIAPDPDVVTLAFLLESHGLEMVEVHGKQKTVSLRERQYMLALAGENLTCFSINDCIV